MHTHSSWASRLLDSKSCHPCLPLLTAAVCLRQQNTLKVQDFSACWDSRHGLGATGSPDLQTLISWTCSAFEENISKLSASAGLSRLLWTITALFNCGVRGNMTSIYKAFCLTRSTWGSSSCLQYLQWGMKSAELDFKFHLQGLDVPALQASPEAPPSQLFSPAAGDSIL